MYTRNNNAQQYLSQSPSTYRSRNIEYQPTSNEEAPQYTYQRSSDLTPKKKVIHERLEGTYGRNQSMHLGGKQNVGQNWSQAQHNADQYEKYSHSPLKQSLNMYNSVQMGRSHHRNMKVKPEEFGNSNTYGVDGATMTFCRDAPNNKRNYENMGSNVPTPSSSFGGATSSSFTNSRRRIMSGYNIEDRISPAKQISGNRRLSYYEQSNEKKDTERVNKKENRNYNNYLQDSSENKNNYVYLKRQQNETERQRKLQKDPQVSGNSMRTPRRDASPNPNTKLSENASSLIQKSQLIKQKIQKLSRMTPRGVHQNREQDSFRWISKNNVYYDAQNQNRCSPISSKYSNGGNSGIPSTLPTPNNQHIKEQRDEHCEQNRYYERHEKVERMLKYDSCENTQTMRREDETEQCEVESISIMSRKISDRLKSIIERHG